MSNEDQKSAAKNQKTFLCKDFRPNCLGYYTPIQTLNIKKFEPSKSIWAFQKSILCLCSPQQSNDNTLCTTTRLFSTPHYSHIIMTAAENNNVSTRTNAAGEKYSLRGIYGSEPYWPEAKLKICVTGAGGFIGAQSRFLFAFVRL